MRRRRDDARGADGSCRCSFCGKGQGEVKRLVAGPGVYICSQCIGLCNRIIAKASR